MSAATRGIVVFFLALAVAGLLDARGLRKRAEIQPAGLGRRVALAVTRPLASVSHTLYLDRPRQGLKDAIGRPHDDAVDTTITFTPPPVPVAPPAPAPAPRTHHRVRHRPPPKPVFTEAHPLKVWVAGDSLAEVPGQALQRVADSDPALRVVAVESRVSTGLGRPDVYNWFDRIRAAIASFRPRVAVLSFGADDAHNYLAGAPPGRRIGPLGSTSWVAEYRRRLEGVTRELSHAGAYVVWLGAPMTRGEGRNRGFRVVDRVLRSVVASNPKTSAYVDTWHMFLNKRGRYADYLPDGHGRLVLMRAADGVHYTAPAGDVIAHAVLHQLGKLYELKRRSR